MGALAAGLTLTVEWWPLATLLQALLARDHAGRLVNVGVPPEQGMEITLPMSVVVFQPR